MLELNLKIDRHIEKERERDNKDRVEDLCNLERTFIKLDSYRITN